MNIPTLYPGLARVSKIKFELSCSFLGPKPGPGRLPLDSGRGDAECAGVVASGASLTSSFGAESIFWNPAKIKVKKVVASKTGIQTNHLLWHSCILHVPGALSVKYFSYYRFAPT